MKVRGNLLKGEATFVHSATRQEIMNIKQMIKKLGGNRAAIARQAGIGEPSLNNMVSKGKEVLKLADGRYITLTKHSVIFGEPDNDK